MKKIPPVAKDEIIWSERLVTEISMVDPLRAHDRAVTGSFLSSSRDPLNQNKFQDIQKI